MKTKLDDVYKERNTVLAGLMGMAHALLVIKPDYMKMKIGRALHSEGDLVWSCGWRNIIVLEMCGEQMTWHVHDSDMKMFEWLPLIENYEWDGHSTDEKYERLKTYLLGI